MVEVDFIDVDVVVVDLVEVCGVEEDVEGLDEDYLMNNLVRFGTYHWLNLDCRS